MAQQQGVAIRAAGEAGSQGIAQAECGDGGIDAGPLPRAARHSGAVPRRRAA